MKANEITLTITKDLILRLWRTVPESEKFGEVETIKQCVQQPDVIQLSRGKKKNVTFSVRSFQVLSRDEPPNRLLGWYAID